MEQKPHPPFLEFPESDVAGLERQASRVENLIKKKVSKAGYESEFWGECTEVLELGAGQGAVALALSRLTPDSCKIVTVDYNVPIDQHIRDILGARLEEHTGELVVDYLTNSRRKFDLITICSVAERDHRIKDSSLLARALNRKGFVFDFVTGLSRQMMDREFSLLELKDGVKIWVKKGFLARVLK